MKCLNLIFYLQNNFQLKKVLNWDVIYLCIYLLILRNTKAFFSEGY